MDFEMLNVKGTNAGALARRGQEVLCLGSSLASATQ